MSEEKVTVQVAAKALNVTPKTIHRWVKLGTLSKVKEGNRAYIPMDEIRAIRQGHSVTSKDDVPINSLEVGHNNNIVPIERDHYEGLLTRLGQLEAKQELLLEYKAASERKDRDIAETRAALSKANEALTELVKIKQDAEAKSKVLLDQQAENERLKTEVENLKRPWWKRLFQR